jgi:lysozyme family protein
MTTSKRPAESGAEGKSSKEDDTAGLIAGIEADREREIKEFNEKYAFSSADLDYLKYLAESAAGLRRIRFEEVKDEYSRLWAEMAIRRERLPAIKSIVERIVRHKDKYVAVQDLTRVPWYAVAIIHILESGGDFSRHLHNGDPLTARTVHVPAGRPTSGNPPFTWVESATDAVEYKGLTQVRDWSIERLAYVLEDYNGWGYRLYHPHVKSPYLWSFSNHYTKGKYVGDGQFSEEAVSQQCGGMVLLKQLRESGEVRLEGAASNATCAAQEHTSRPTTWCSPAQDYDLLTWDELARGYGAVPCHPLERSGPGEKVLRYDHSIVPQETGYWCGPAAAQVVLNSRGIHVTERELARSIGTHMGGTDYVGLIERDLDRRVPEAKYLSVYMPNDPPTSAQRERLWKDLLRGIDAGWGMIMNWVAPQSNYPRGVKGSTSPEYRGGTIYHYVTAMGYDDGYPGGAVWIADSGFPPFGYWCSFNQVATLIPPKGYTYADVTR